MWVFNSKRIKGDGVHFFIGCVKIAEIQMDKRATKWHYYLRLMRNDVSYDIPKLRHETFASALTELHRLLNAVPPEEHTVP